MSPSTSVQLHDEESKFLQSKRELEQLNILKIVVLKVHVAEVLRNLHLTSFNKTDTDADDGHLYIFCHADSANQMSTRVLRLESIIGVPEVVMQALVKVLQLFVS